MRRNLKAVMKISISVTLISLFVMTQVAFALDPQGYGDGNYPFNDDMSDFWSISPDFRCSITTYGSGDDPPPNTDAGNYEYVHWTGYVWGWAKFDMDCYAWVCAYYTSSGNDYVLVVGRLDMATYWDPDKLYSMSATFTIPDAYTNDNTIRAWEIKYVDRALPDGNYYYSVSYGDLYWEYMYTVTGAGFHRDALDANDGWGSGYKRFDGKYSWGLSEGPNSASYYWAVIIESRNTETLFLEVEFEGWAALWGLGYAFKDIYFEVTHQGYTGGGGGCPTLFVWDGDEYAEEGILNIHAESDVTVQHWIQNTLALENGVYKAQLRELDEFISHIDQVKLYAVDDEGEWHLCPLIYAYHNELGKVKWTLRFDDDNRVNLKPTEVIDLKFGQPIPYSKTEYFIFEINGYNLKPLMENK